MASLNTSHHQDGGILLFNGELILVYCDQVSCEVEGKGSAKGRIYLTTHRIVFTAKPINQNRQFQSLTAPFYAMFDLKLEQPVFGSNYIKGKVRTSSDNNTSATDQNVYLFKLKFNRGGAIEFGQALSSAAKEVTRIAQQSHFQPPPPYTDSATSQYYQAPDHVYQPQYPIGFALPTQIFTEAPPSGFVYTNQAPPPYPGLYQPNIQQNPSTLGGSSVNYPPNFSSAYDQNCSPPAYEQQAQPCSNGPVILNSEPTYYPQNPPQQPSRTTEHSYPPYEPTKKSN